MLRKSLLIGLLVFQAHVLHSSCAGCARGESLASLTTGPGGGLLLSNLFNNATSAIVTVYLPGSAIAFNGTPLVAGTAITQTNPTTFTFTETGHYLVNFIGYSALATLLGGVEFTLNGVPQSANPTLALAGASLPLQQIVNVTTAPSILQVVTTGLALTVGSGTQATITLVQLNSP
jgi:hypothetical protein